MKKTIFIIPQILVFVNKFISTSNDKNRKNPQYNFLKIFTIFYNFSQTIFMCFSFIFSLYVFLSNFFDFFRISISLSNKEL